jgi:hypothetical protein
VKKIEVLERNLFSAGKYRSFQIKAPKVGISIVSDFSYFKPRTALTFKHNRVIFILGHSD